MESEILGFGILNTAQGIRNPTNHWNPEFQVPMIKNPESSTWDSESTVWNPESKTLLIFLIQGDMITLYWVALAPARKPCWIRPLFTHTNANNLEIKEIWIPES